MKRLLILALLCFLTGCSSVDRIIAFKSVSITRNYQWEEAADTWKKYYLTFNFYLFPGSSLIPKPVWSDAEQEDRVFKIQQMNHWLEGKNSENEP